MPKAKLSAISLYYEVHGKGAPLVLIAGLASDSQSWQPVLKGLAENFKVIIFDNRGIGRTQYPKENFRISTLALDTICLLDHMEIEKAYILGHSMGGCIAQDIAINYPQRVSKLILANACAVLSRKNKSIFGGLLEILESGKDYELFIRKFFDLIFTPEYLGNRENIEEAVKYALCYPFPVTQEGFRLQLEAFNDFNSKERLKKIKTKTLIMASKKDALIDSGEVRILADNIPFSEVLYLEKASHSFQVERPDIFTGSVVKFCSKI